MEDNELMPKLEGSKPKNGRGIFIGIIIAVSIWMNAYLMVIVSKQSDKLDSKNNTILKEKADRSSCVYKRDSMAAELNRLAIYKSLTESMVYRDEAIMELRHKVGDVAYAKRDSAKVVISDIVIGGSKYEYYIRYRVLRKDNTSEEIIPELLY